MAHRTYHQRHGHHRKRHKRRNREIDHLREEEIQEKIAKINAKRQAVIDIINHSLERRRNEKAVIEREKLEKDVRLRQKMVRNAKKSRGEQSMQKIREDMSKIIEAGIKYVCTSNIVPEKVKFDGKGTLTVGGVKYKVKKNLHLVGWGRETLMMSSALERIVGNQLKKGWLVVPRKSLFMMSNYPEAFPMLNSHITYIEVGADGQPDEKAVTTAKNMMRYCKKLKKRDLLIVMLSEDADALLCCPRESITLKDKIRVLNRLKDVNATPAEINVVRNKLSAIRGGELARIIYPAKIILLITSNSSAEPLTDYAGGPCSYDPKDTAAFKILQKYGLIDKVSQSVRELVEGTHRSNTAADKRLDQNKKYKFVQQYVIASTADAINGMAVEAFRLGLIPVKLNSIYGESVKHFAREYVKLASLMILAVEEKITKLEMYESMKDSPVCPLSEKDVRDIFPTKDKWALGLCLLLGGQPTMQLSSDSGKSGPNQELALYFSLYWYLRTEQYPILRGYTVWFLGGSSTGRDGNTNDVGAFGYKNLGTGVYLAYKTANAMRNASYRNKRELTEYGHDETAVLRAEKEATELDVIQNKHAAILPDRVLKEHNTNLLFQSINDGDELLRLKTGNYYTFTNVGDLHIIRIVRFQCNCDSSCHDRICTDLECPVTDSLDPFGTPKSQCCSKLGKLKKI